MLVGRKLLIDLLLDYPYLAGCFFASDARFQPSDNLKIVRAMQVVGRLALEGNPQIRGDGTCEVWRIRRHDADYGVSHAVKHDRAADDARIGTELAAPKILTDETNVGSSLGVLGRQK
jgi:hypothetical protein